MTSKVLLFLSAACLLILVVGTHFFAQSSVFWLASGQGNYQIIREVLAAVLFIQIVTDPPRNILFRIISCIFASVIGFWAVEATYNDRMQLLDLLAFLSASVAIAVTSLEVKVLPEEIFSTTKTVKV